MDGGYRSPGATDLTRTAPALATESLSETSDLTEHLQALVGEGFLVRQIPVNDVWDHNLPDHVNYGILCPESVLPLRRQWMQQLLGKYSPSLPLHTQLDMAVGEVTFVPKKIFIPQKQGNSVVLVIRHDDTLRLLKFAEPAKTDTIKRLLAAYRESCDRPSSAFGRGRAATLSPLPRLFGRGSHALDS